MIFRNKGDDASIYVKENLDVGNVYHFSLGLPRNFYSYFIHDLFGFLIFRSIILEVWAVCEFAMERSFLNKANPFIWIEFLYFHFVLKVIAFPVKSVGGKQRWRVFED